MIRAALLLSLLVAAPAAAQPASEMARWRATAARVTITRDDFGIAHIKGRSDADAVFGMIYAQAEDDFNRVETNFINAQGRLAEAEGESAVWRDLRMKLFIDPADLKADYARAPAWLKALSVAWADALNFYLATHPQVKPRVITRFEPWMALSFSEGSIGGDIEGINLDNLAAFYGAPQRTAAAADPWPEPAGSNGFAIGPSRSADGRALLVINPHTSFYFRSEAQVQSDEGLDAYGASTWGQFFVYQGFNRHLGWMHTSSGIDNIDEFALTVEERGGKRVYRTATGWQPLAEKTIVVPVRRPDGTMEQRRFTTWRSQHGPVIRAENGKWVAISLMHRPLAALEQSFLRTKTRDLADYLKVAERRANSSNATLFASDKGEIAYLHPQFLPIRDDSLDWSRPVDAADPRARWTGEHSLAQLPSVLNPKSGWAFNTNNWPWTAAGPDSPREADYSRYADRAGENPRGPNAVRLLSGTNKFTPDTLLELAYDSYLTAFADLVPTLTAAYDRLPAGDPLRDRLAAPMAAMRGWNHRWGADSVPMSLAAYWGEALIARYGTAARAERTALVPYLVRTPTDADRLAAFDTAVQRIAADFGRWDTPWGEINRFQRLTANIEQRYDDRQPSTPVPFASGNWGSLASYGSRPRDGTKRWYGDYGNSFVAVVAFGPNGPEARAVSAGGQSGDPASPHFRDQAQRYATHDFRRVYLTAADLQGHTARVYRPGT